MRWHPDPNDRAAWSAVGGVVMAAGAAGAIGWLAVAGTASTHEPLWPVYAFVAVAIVGLYGMLAPLLHLPPWRSRRSQAGQSWQQGVINSVQERMARAVDETPENRARRQARDTADALAELHADGRRLRERVKPEHTPLHLLVLQAYRFPSVPAQEETNARQWDARVKAELTARARRFVPEWEGIAGLPPGRSDFTAVRLIADGRRIATFMDSKLALLLRFITELRDGK
jgi:hypothetical protein